MVTRQRCAQDQRVLCSVPSEVDILRFAVEAKMDFLSGLQRVIDKGTPAPPLVIRGPVAPSFVHGGSRF